MANIKKIEKNGKNFLKIGKKNPTLNYYSFSNISINKGIV